MKPNQTIKVYIFKVLCFGSLDTKRTIEAYTYEAALESLYFPEIKDPAPVCTADVIVIKCHGVYVPITEPTFYDDK